MSVGVIFVILYFLGKHTFAYAEPMTQPWWKIILFGSICFVAMMISVSIWEYIVPADTVSGNQQQLISVFTTSNLIPYSIYLGVMSPFIEEIVYREVIIGDFFDDNRLLGAIISVVIFAGGHIQEFSISIIGTYIILSIFMTIPYYYLRDIRGSIFIHILNNVIGVISILNLI